MLKTIGKLIPLITDYNMHLMVESGIQGGFCNVSKRHLCANNRYMGDNFDEDLAREKGEMYLAYFYANNLYGFSLSEPLPYGVFEWVHYNDLKPLKENLIRKMPVDNDGKQGYIM